MHKYTINILKEGIPPFNWKKLTVIQTGIANIVVKKRLAFFEMWLTLTQDAGRISNFAPCK